MDGARLADVLPGVASALGATDAPDPIGLVGALDGVRTRLSILDFGVRTGFGRMALQFHNIESNADFLNGLKPHHFDQGMTLRVIGGDSLGPAWSVQARGLDDRLSGTGIGARELRLRLVSSLGELLDDLLIEGREIVGVATRDKAVIGLDLLVDPVAASIADIGLEARPGGQGAPAHHIGLDESPRPVADRPHRLSGLEEAFDEADSILVDPQIIGVDDAPRQDERVILGRLRFLHRFIDRAVVDNQNFDLITAVTGDFFNNRGYCFFFIVSRDHYY